MDLRSSLDGSVALSHLGVLRARGADASAFLQSQLTNDIGGLEPDRTRLAGFCSAKGRLQASFLVWRLADDDVVLICAKDLLAATSKRLSMFVLRARCRLTDASDDFVLRGHVGRSGSGETEAGATTRRLAAWERREVDGTTCVRLPDAEGLPRLLVAAPAAAGAPTTAASRPDSEIPLDRWRWLEVRSGVPLIEAATVDRFVPQMLNFELLGGVDFRKGCYPGQEVVARSQYRGTIKRRMFLFDGDAALNAGQDVFHDADPGQPAGTVVNGAPAPTGGSSALVEVKLAALDAGALHVGAPDGPILRRTALPYDVA